MRIDHLAKRIKFFRKYPKVDLIYTTAKIIGEEKDFFVPDARNTNKLIHLNDCVIGATLFGKQKVFKNIKWF